MGGEAKRGKRARCTCWSRICKQYFLILDVKLCNVVEKLTPSYSLMTNDTQANDDGGGDDEDPVRFNSSTSAQKDWTDGNRVSFQ